MTPYSDEIVGMVLMSLDDEQINGRDFLQFDEGCRGSWSKTCSTYTSCLSLPNLMCDIYIYFKNLTVKNTHNSTYIAVAI